MFFKIFSAYTFLRRRNKWTNTKENMFLIQIQNVWVGGMEMANLWRLDVLGIRVKKVFPIFFI